MALGAALQFGCEGLSGGRVKVSLRLALDFSVLTAKVMWFFLHF